MQPQRLIFSSKARFCKATEKIDCYKQSTLIMKYLLRADGELLDENDQLNEFYHFSFLKICRCFLIESIWVL